MEYYVYVTILHLCYDPNPTRSGTTDFPTSLDMGPCITYPTTCGPSFEKDLCVPPFSVFTCLYIRNFIFREGI